LFAVFHVFLVYVENFTKFRLEAYFRSMSSAREPDPDEGEGVERGGNPGYLSVGSSASRVLGGIALFAFWLQPPRRCLYSGLCI